MKVKNRVSKTFGSLGQSQREYLKRINMITHKKTRIHLDFLWIPLDIKNLGYPVSAQTHEHDDCLLPQISIAPRAL